VNSLPKKGTAEKLTPQHGEAVDFQNLPPEIQSFIVKPTNRPYLDLAIKLSEMSVEKLRSIAEGLLEITY